MCRSRPFARTLTTRISKVTMSSNCYVDPLTKTVLHHQLSVSARLESLSTATIRPNSYNPNQQSDYEFELLCRSINEDGFTQPIVCQRETREFVDGEHRWTAAIVHHYLKKNGLEISTQNCREARDQRFEILDPSLEIPVVFVEMSIEQMRI